MRESMEIYPRTATEQAMKLQEVLLREMRRQDTYSPQGHEMHRLDTFSPSVRFACDDSNAVRSTRRLL
jgi:hypothetical protein